MAVLRDVLESIHMRRSSAQPDSDLFSAIGSHARSQAEIAAGVTPTNYAYIESDIARTGAATGAADNSAAINNALLVSAFGGNAGMVHAAPSVYKITASISATLTCSLSGQGQSSSIAPQACNGITFTNQGVFLGSRFFQDFTLIGSGTSTNIAINAAMTAASGNQINGVIFDNISVQGFQYAVNGQGYYRCTWRGCYFFNNTNGFNFTEQSVKLTIVDCHVIKSPIATHGDGSTALNCDQSGGVRPQDITATGCFLYGHDIGVAFGNILYGAVENCDIDQTGSTCVAITTMNGGCRVRNSWLNTNANAATTGILVNALGAANNDLILLEGNYISCTQANSGSVGISVGNNQKAVAAYNNTIGGANSAFATGISSSGANFSAKFNTINATINAILLNTGASIDVEIGPNKVIPGAAQVATCTNASANIGVVDSTKFPVGSYCQFDATANGFTVGVDYTVLSSAANVITVGPSGGAAIIATGATAVNVFPQLPPVIFSGATPIGFRLHARGKFPMSLTGMTAVTLGIASWEATGGLVTVSIPSAGILGTSNVTTLTGLGVPQHLWPVTDQSFYCTTVNSGVAAIAAGTIAAATGVITFFKDVAGSAFTNSGTKGLSGGTLSWPYL